MHRLFTATALIVSGLLISMTADAGPGGGPHVKVFDGTPASRGESVEPKHKDWINLNKVVAIRWAPGIESRNVRVRGRIRMNAKGEPQHGALQVLKQVDKASPLLARAVKNREPLARIILIVPATQGDAAEKPYYHYELKNARITSFQTDGSAGKAKKKKTKVRPMETISLNF